MQKSFVIGCVILLSIGFVSVQLFSCKESQGKHQDLIQARCIDSFQYFKKEVNLELARRVERAGLEGSIKLSHPIKSDVVGTNRGGAIVAIGCPVELQSTIELEVEVRLASTLNADGEIYHSEYSISGI